MRAGCSSSKGLSKKTKEQEYEVQNIEVSTKVGQKSNNQSSSNEYLALDRELHLRRTPTS